MAIAHQKQVYVPVGQNAYANLILAFMGIYVYEEITFVLRIHPFIKGYAFKQLHE